MIDKQTDRDARVDGGLAYVAFLLVMLFEIGKRVDGCAVLRVIVSPCRDH